MLNIIDSFLNNITMYRLVLYVLIAFLLIAGVFGAVGILPFSPFSLLFSTLIFLVACYITNKVFAFAFDAPTNTESLYITALILALIITPLSLPSEISTGSIKSLIDHVVPMVWISIWAMASKYILAMNKKHLFNPVAIAAVITSFGIGFSGSWWVGNAYLMPAVIAGGFLIVRKIQREALVIAFFATAISTAIYFGLSSGTDMLTTISQLFLHSSLLFFAFIMLTEPLTTPPTKMLQILYGAFVGILFSPQINFLGVSSTPELALVVGNAFSYLVSPKQKLLLSLKEKIQVAPDVFDFIFQPDQKLNFLPGQYLEWTLSHPHADSRGTRRYFTIASSPTEKEIHLGVKFNQKGSSFKNDLLQLTSNKKMTVGQLAGEFTLPEDPKEKLVFIAGGIGITPFRSMIKYLIDKGERRDIVLLYADKSSETFMYTDVFRQAVSVGVKTLFTVTDTTKVPQGWNGLSGRISAEIIQKEIPDFAERYFYLSGPRSMITNFENTLKRMNIPKSHIKTDFFPGFV